MSKRIIDPAELAALESNEKPFFYDPTLEEWLLFWLESFILPQCRPSTCMNFRSYILSHICPLLGDYHLKELRTVMIQYFVNHQLTKGRLDQNGGLSRKTVSEQFQVLSRALRKAVAMGYLEYDPCQAVVLPQKEQKAQRTLTVEEQQSISEVVDPTWKENSLLPVLLGEYAGLRIGEIAGLQVGDIDLEHRKIHIQRSLNRFPITDAQGNLHSKLIYGKTKNGKERFVPMNDDLYRALYTYLTTMPSMHKRKKAPLFINTRGNPMEPKMIRFYFNRCMRELSITDIHFHSLRHTFATRALEAGIPIKYCSAMLGHASTGITENLYAHASEEQLRKEIKKLDISYIPVSAACRIVQ